MSDYIHIRPICPSGKRYEVIFWLDGKNYNRLEVYLDDQWQKIGEILSHMESDIRQGVERWIKNA